MQLLPGSGLFLALRGDGFQARGNARKPALGGKLENSPAVLVVDSRKPARARPAALRTQARQLTIQIEIIAILLGPVDDLRMAEYAVIEVVIARAERGNFRHHLVDGTVPDLRSENVGDRAE